MLSKYYSFKYKEKKDQWPKLWCVNAVHPWFKKESTTLLIMAMHVRESSIQEISIPSYQFCCKSKTAFKRVSKKITPKVDVLGKIFVSLLYMYIYITYVCLLDCDIKMKFLDQKSLQGTVVKLYQQIKAQINLKKQKTSQNLNLPIGKRMCLCLSMNMLT